jgi:hypothetical protein
VRPNPGTPAAGSRLGSRAGRWRAHRTERVGRVVRGETDPSLWRRPPLPRCEPTERALCGRLIDTPELFERPDVGEHLFGCESTLNYFRVLRAAWRQHEALDPVIAHHALRTAGYESAAKIVFTLVDEAAEVPWLAALETLLPLADARIDWRLIDHTRRADMETSPDIRGAMLAAAVEQYATARRLR